MKRSDIQGSIRRKYEDPSEVSAYTALADDGLTEFEAALIHRSFRPGQRVLDVGCGGGREAAPMSQYGLRVTAMDFIPAMVRAAQAHVVSRGQAGSFLVGDLMRLPFREASFDGVTMLEQLLAFIPGRDRRVEALRSVWKVLRPGGRLAMTTHNRRSHWKFRLYFSCVNRFRKVVRQLGYDGGLSDYDRWSARITHASSPRKVFFHMYDLEEAVTDLKTAGFEVLEAKDRTAYEGEGSSGARDYLLGFIAWRPGAGVRCSE